MAARAPPAIDACWNRIGVRGDGSCPELARHVHCRHCPAFGAPPPRAALKRLIVVDRGGARFAFPVDEVHGLARFAAGAAAPVPATMQGAACHTRAVLKHGERTIGWLDPAPLWQTLERGATA